MKHVWYVVYFLFSCINAFPLDDELYNTCGKDGKKKKVVRTIEDIVDILRRHHSDAMGGHSGVNATLHKISNYYCWNGMKEDVQEYVSSHTVYTYK